MRLHSLLVVAVAVGLPACSSDGVTPTDAGTTDAPSSKDGNAGADTSTDAPGPDAPTPRYAIDLQSTSVSGLSSGGFMAVQFHVAFSSIMKGAAIFAGGPYLCSGGSVTKALTTCAAGSPPSDIPSLVTATNQSATAGAIDDPSALATQQVFLFSGADDNVVNPTVMDALDAYYASFMPSGSIEYVNRRPATSHTWPTLAYGGSCDAVAPPYIGNCGFDGAGAALTRIYGALAPAAATLGGAFIPIAQGSYIADPVSHSLDDTAWAYVPAACTAGDTCKIHVSFHGCLQGANDVGDAFYAHAGLDEWADTNHIIVLYPQAVRTGKNPEGCWDFWGYDSAEFATKTAPQMAMVRAMVDALVQ